MIKGCKSIAEYRIRKWMDDNGFADGCFDLTVTRNIGTITDCTGESMNVIYCPDSKTVKEMKSNILSEAERRAKGGRTWKGKI